VVSVRSTSPVPSLATTVSGNSSVCLSPAARWIVPAGGAVSWNAAPNRASSVASTARSVSLVSVIGRRILSPEVTSLTEDFAFQREDGKVVYFHGLLPVFQHDEKDLKSFRMFTSQLIANGTVRQRDIVRAFGVPLGTVKRYMKVHRQHGTAGFFRPQRRRSANVLTAEVKLRAQALLDEGKSVPEVSGEIGVAGNTLHKAIQAGRLHAFKKKR